VEGNVHPLTASYELGTNTLPYVSSRIKMRKSSNVIVVLKANGKLYIAKKLVKVTLGGCGS
jgi:sulfur-oxidizing protein SoxY